MSVRRVMEAETEYGISVPGQPGANAMVTSSQFDHGRTTSPGNIILTNGAWAVRLRQGQG